MGPPADLDWEAATVQAMGGYPDREAQDPVASPTTSALVGSPSDARKAGGWRLLH